MGVRRGRVNPKKNFFIMKTVSEIVDPKIPYQFTNEFSKNSLVSKEDVKFNKNECNERTSSKRGFHQAIAPALIIFQCCGLMPVIGITSKDSRDLSFSWCSFRTIYSVIYLISAIAYLVLIALWGVEKHLILACQIEVIGLSLVLAFINFFRLAQKWPLLMAKWEAVERKLPYNRKEDILARRIKYFLFASMVICFVEQATYISQHISMANYCSFTNTSTAENFFRMTQGHIFYVLDYSFIGALSFEIIFFFYKISWNCIHILLVLVSLGLSSNFGQLNYSLMKVKGKQTNQLFWKEHRENYQNICNLCMEMSEAISILTMVSMFNTLFTISHVLLDIFSKETTLRFNAGNCVFVALLMLRLLAISLSSARIGEESKFPFRVFRSVPSESWCLEIDRFYEEVKSAKAELSGMGFFHLNRAMILKALGIIVTFELILIQYGVYEKLETRGCHVQLTQT